MGLFDLFREYFPANQESLGPNDLPSDVLNDLKDEARKDQSESNGFCDHDETIYELHIPTHELHIPTHDGDLRDYQHQQSFHTFNEGFENTFREMDSMFKSFFGDDPGFDVFRGGIGINSEDGGGGREKTLREKMLDEDEGSSHEVISPFPDERNQSHGVIFTLPTPMFGDLWQSPFNQREQMDDNSPVQNEDQDLDGEYGSGAETLDSLFNKRDEGVSRNGQGELGDMSIFTFGNQLPSDGYSSSFKCSTITKKINPDGSVETTSKKQDSDGNEEVVISRSFGDQTYSVTSKKNKDGEEEKVENFINMDEDDLENFKGKWKSKDEQGRRDLVISPDQNEFTTMKNLSDIFSSWWKPM